MQLSSTARRAMAAGLAVSTIVWSMAMFVMPVAFAAPHGNGCLINQSGTIYLVENGVKRGFPSADVYASHGQNFGQVVTANSEDNSLPTGPVMVYRDGTLVKGPSDPLVYLVANGQKRGFISGSVYTGLGYSWANVRTAAVNTFADLPTGANLESATERHTNGILVKDSTNTIWLMTATGKKGIPSMEVFNSYGYNMGLVVPANAADVSAANEGVLTARVVCADSAVVSGSVNVSLASDTPAATTLVQAQAMADLAHFTFTGTGTVNSITLKRIGVSGDDALTNVYLFDGATRVTDASSVSSGNINFNNGSGLFTVSGSKTVTVKADMKSTGISGQTVGVQLTTVALSSGTVGGLPVSGNIHSIATASLAGVAFNASTTPGTTSIDPANDVVVWQNTVTTDVRDVSMTRMALRQTNNINTSDIKNFRLLIDGASVATVASLDSNGYVTFAFNKTLTTGSHTVKVLADITGGSTRKVTMSLRGAYDVNFTDSVYSVGILPTVSSGSFPLTTGEVTIASGSPSVQKATDSASGNVTLGGSDISLGKFQVSAFGEPIKIEKMKAGFTYTNAGATFATGTYTLADAAVLVDETYTATINGTAVVYTAIAADAAGTDAVDTLAIMNKLATAIDANATVGPLVNAVVTDAAGSTTITLTAVTKGTVGNYTTTAADTSAGGTLVATAAAMSGGVGTANAAATLRNGKLLINGTQYGNTQTLLAAGTEFTTNYTVNPGTPVTVEVKADIYDNDGTGVINSGDTILAKIVGGDLDNAQGTVSLSTLDIPTGDVSGGTLTVSQGTIDLSKQGNYGTQTTTLPRTAFPIAKFNLTGNSTEDVNIDSLTMDITQVNQAAGGNDFNYQDLTSVYVMYGTTKESQKATVSASGNTWSLSRTLTKNAVVPVEIFADIGNLVDASDSFKTTVTISGTTVGSNRVVTSGAKDGQTIVYGAGTLASAVDGQSPVAAIHDDNSTFTAGAFKFTATNDTFAITDLTFTVGSNPTTVQNVIVKDGSTVVATKPVSGSTVTFSGLNVTGVKPGTPKTLTVDLQVGEVGSGAGTSGENVNVTLTAFKANGSGTGTVSDTNSRAAANHYVFKAIPTITPVALPVTTLTAGSMTVAKFTVGANGTGTIAWQNLKLTYSASAGTTAGTFAIYDANNQSVKIADGTDNAGVVTFAPASEQEIGTSKTYVVKATIGGDVTDAYVTSNITAADTNFNEGDGSTSLIWSDVSDVAHTTLTSDWYSDFLVNGLPTDSQTVQN